MAKDEAERKAEAYANKQYLEQGPEFIVWSMCRDDFLAGYAEARQAVLAELREWAINKIQNTAHCPDMMAPNFHPAELIVKLAQLERVK